MGLNMSMLQSSHEAPPKRVLVPPLFERDLKARSRMVKSSYDYLFAKPALRWLFKDYYAGQGINSVLYFAPSADPRVSVKAKLGTGDAGTMALRYQPYGITEPLCFIDVKANPRVHGDVTLRACGFSTDSGLGAFATLPLARKLTGKQPEVGMRYSSPTFTVGAAMQPMSNAIGTLWACGRYDAMTAGVQLRNLAPEQLQAAQSSPGGLLQYLRQHTSMALSYSPLENRTRAGQPYFTAAMELEEGRNFAVSFFQHLATVRQVFNPIEDDNVIGITNYIDIGIRMVMPLAPEDNTAAKEPGLQLGGAWQANKNVYIKGKLDSTSAAMMFAFKSWFQPSLALATSVEYVFKERKPRYGLTIQVENFGTMRYERSREAEAHGRVLTQEHEATNAEIAMSEGMRPQVDLAAQQGDFNKPEPASTIFL